MAFGTVAVQDVQNAEVTVVILGAQYGDFVKKIGLPEALLGGNHPLHGAAIHGLNGIFHQRILQRRDIPDISGIAFDPAGDAAGQLVDPLQHQRIVTGTIKSDDRIAAEILHVADQFYCGAGRETVSVESLSCAGTYQGAIGTDEPDRYAKLLGHRQGVIVAASGGQNDFNAIGMGVLQGGEVARRYPELRVKQGAVNIDGNQANRRAH